MPGFSLNRWWMTLNDGSRGAAYRLIAIDENRWSSVAFQQCAMTGHG